MKNMIQHIQLFNKIAFGYGFFYKYQQKGYMQTARLAKLDQFPFETSFLDIGSGTGALASVLFTLGYDVIGLDASEKMVEVAKEKTKELEIEFVLGSAVDLPFKDKSIDVCIASYVAHGFSPQVRKQMLIEMKRVSKSKVILIEFSKKRHWLIDFLEKLEKSDYFNFIFTIESELKSIFDKVKKSNTSPYQDVWICDI